VNALVVQADCLFQLGHFSGAASAARQLLGHDGRNPLYWFLLTRALNDAEQWDEALDAAEQWIRVDASGNAWSRKASALLSLDRPEEARKAAEVALAMRPEDPGALSLASCACVGCIDLESALNYAERWTAAAPESQEAQEWLEKIRKLMSSATEQR
jgi:tetratricopeptide (TPR) repeat protein